MGFCHKSIFFISGQRETRFRRDRQPLCLLSFPITNRGVYPDSCSMPLNRAYFRGRFCNKIKGKQIYNWEVSEHHRSLISGVV